MFFFFDKRRTSCLMILVEITGLLDVQFFNHVHCACQNLPCCAILIYFHLRIIHGKKMIFHSNQ